MKKFSFLRSSQFIIFTSILCGGLLVGCENSEQQLSATFSLPVTFGNGTDGEYLLIGKEGKVGFLIGSGEKGEAVEEPIIANKENKYMWHFWGEQELLSGDFKVVGIDEKGKEHPVLVTDAEQVWEYTDIIASPNDVADSHIPSNILFPTSGLWTLRIYFNDKLFEEIVVNVEDAAS